MSKYGKFDFAKAHDLMEFIVAAGKHGPMFNVMMGMAQEELKDMLAEAGAMVKEVHRATPPDGPENSVEAVAEIPKQPVEETEKPALEQPVITRRVV